MTNHTTSIIPVVLLLARNMRNRWLCGRVGLLAGRPHIDGFSIQTEFGDIFQLITQQFSSDH